MKKFLASFICLIFILQIVCVGLPEIGHGFTVRAEGNNDLFVSNQGNDSWSGKLAQPNANHTDGPLATVQAAKAKLLSNKTDNATVWIRGGMYFVGDTMAFTASDSQNITYSAYNNEKVVINGGYAINNWQVEYVNGIPVWSSPISTDKINELNTLYTENGVMQNSRYPETGYIYSNGADNADALNPSNINFAQNTSFYARSGDFKDFYNIKDIYIKIYHFWTDDMATVVSFDSSDNKVRISNPTKCTVGAKDAYCLLNVKEALDKPGEWYVDRAKSKIYYVPFADETIDNTTVYAGNVIKMMSFDNSKNISFNGICFKNTNWKFKDISSQAAYTEYSAFTVNNSEGINFENCTFENIGAGAVEYGVVTSNCSVNNCDFHDIGAQAVVINGYNDANKVTHNITVSNNHVYDYGQRRAQAVAIFQTYAKNCLIENNEIHDGPYSAISVGWTWGYGSTVTGENLIRNNLIYNIGHDALSDMGGIYMLGIQNGTEISGNVVHDVAAGKDASTYGGWGIYLDEGSTNVTVENNLVYRCDSQGFHQHYGQDNYVQNNIFALNSEGQVRCSRSEDHNEINLNNNILVGDNNVMYQNFEKGRFKDNNNLYYDYSATPGTVYSGNIREANSESNYDKDTMKNTYGYYNNGVFTNPDFIDVDNNNFGFNSNKGYSRISFVPFSVDNVGCNRIGSKYLVNRLSHKMSYYPAELVAQYNTAKENAIKARTTENILALEQAYKALENYNGSGLKTITNLSGWTTTKTATATARLAVSGVSGGTGLSRTLQTFTSMPNQKTDTTVKVYSASKNDYATASIYVDRSVYTDMSQTQLRIGGYIDSATGRSMRYYCGLQETSFTTPVYGVGTSIIAGGNYYHIEKGNWEFPFLGYNGGHDTTIADGNFGGMDCCLNGAVPAKGNSAEMRVVSVVLVYSESAGYYYSFNDYINLTIYGVDKGELRKAYYACKDAKISSDVLNSAYAVLMSDTATQTQIDSAEQSLMTAYAGTQHITVATDKSALKNAVNNCKPGISAQYSAVSWKEYYSAYEIACDVLNNKVASQSQVNEAVANLTAKYNALVNCDALIKALSECPENPQSDFSQYVWYEYTNSKSAASRAFVNSKTAAEINIAANNLKQSIDNIKDYVNTGKTVTNHLRFHKYNHAIGDTSFYIKGVGSATNISEYYEFDDMPNKRTYEQWNLYCNSPNTQATADVYVDRSLYTDLSQTGLTIGANIEDIVGKQMRLYLMFVDNHTPTITNRDSVTVNGNKYTLSVGTYNNPVIGQPGGGNAIVGSETKYEGKSGSISGAIPAKGSSASMLIAACTFVLDNQSESLFCVNNYINLNVHGVDKSELRSYAFDKYASAESPQSSYSAAAYLKYQIALENAKKMIYNDSVPQTEIDSAAQALKTAYENLEKGKMISLKTNLNGGTGGFNLAVWNTVNYDAARSGYPSYNGYRSSYTVSDNTVTFTPESTSQGYAFLPMTLQIKAGHSYKLTLRTTSTKASFLAYNPAYSHGWTAFPQFYQFVNGKFTDQGDGTYLYEATLNIDSRETPSMAYFRVETSGIANAVSVSDICLAETTDEKSLTQTVCYGDQIVLPMPERKNYIFEGWQTSDGKMLDGNVFTAGSSDETLTVKWKIGKTITASENLVIDYESHIIYGVEQGAISISSDVIPVDSEFTVDYESNGRFVHTGYKVNVSCDGEAVDTYTVVLFGDVNGDGWYDGMDAVVVSLIANGMLTKEQLCEAVYMAADCNQDGSIDEFDVEILQQAGLLLQNVDQTKSTEELLATSSDYVEYLNLIDQNPAIEEPADELIDESTRETSFLQWLMSLIVKVFSFIKLHFATIK